MCYLTQWYKDLCLPVRLPACLPACLPAYLPTYLLQLQHQANLIIKILMFA